MSFGVPPLFRGASYGLGELAVEIGSVAESYRLCDEIDRIVLVLQQQFFGLLYPQIGAPAAEIHSEPVRKIHLQYLFRRSEFAGGFLPAFVILAVLLFLYPFFKGFFYPGKTFFFFLRS